jgi:hypothetical protein
VNPFVLQATKARPLTAPVVKCLEPSETIHATRLGKSGVIAFLLVVVGFSWAAITAPTASASREDPPALQRKINFVPKERQRTPTPPGWEEYDGAVYTAGRGYGWVTDIAGEGWDGGGKGEMILPDGTTASPLALGRLELANWQGTHQENLPIVFRIDLPDGWYRVTCTSVDADNAPLPLVDQRSVKFRAHDAVFAGPRYGPPLKVEGNRLIEGSEIVEVTDGHLRIVVGDPAYGGWTWSYEGPFFRGWKSWFGRWGNQRYATGWYQKLTRTVDPGFHSLRFNSLVVAPITAPSTRRSLVFRDLFNRDDHPAINAGIEPDRHWATVSLSRQTLATDLYRTSIRVTNTGRGPGTIGIIQGILSPETGTVRYSTRVSLFTGQGSKLHSGYQEAGLLILGEPSGLTEFNSTFIGVAFDATHPETSGWIVLRIGDGADAFRTDRRLPDTMLPFKVAEGEYKMSVEHDIEQNRLRRIKINDVDITHYFTTPNLVQRLTRGSFGIRSSIDPKDSDVRLQQFYWYYQVEGF